MRIAAIEKLTALSSGEAELLDQLLERADEQASRRPTHPSIERANLVVYVVTGPDGGETKIVAPASEALRAGMRVVASGYTTFAQRVSQDSGEGARLDLAAALKPHDRDL